MNKEFLHMQKLAGIITESEYKAMLNENPQYPEWYDSFVQQLATKFGIDVEDLSFEMVDPHLMGIEGDIFTQEALNKFPTVVRSILRQPEFKGKALMVWGNTGNIENKLVEKHPELEDYIYNDEKFWIYIK